jgi:hypothetical protein
MVAFIAGPPTSRLLQACALHQADRTPPDCTANFNAYTAVAEKLICQTLKARVLKRLAQISLFAIGPSDRVIALASIRGLVEPPYRKLFLCVKPRPYGVMQICLGAGSPAAALGPEEQRIDFGSSRPVFSDSCVEIACS